MELKDRIREAMEGAGLKPLQLAKATRRSSGAVTQWIDGTTKSLKADTASALERATGYRADWIVTGRGEKKLAITTPNIKWSLEPQSGEVAQPEQASSREVCTLEQSLEGLAAYLASLDESDRQDAMKMLSALADRPDKHVKVAAAIKAMVGAPFANQDRRAA